MILSTQQIGDVCAGKLNEARFPIDYPPEWERGSIVQLRNGDRRRRGTGIYVEVLGFQVATQNGEEEWVLYFQPSSAPHETRSLTYTARPKGSEKGYTKISAYAMRGEGEALTEAEQQARSQEGRSAHSYHKLRECREHKERLRQLPIADRIDLAVKAARRNRVDVRSNRRIINKLIRDGKPTGAILQHLVVLERRAYKWPE